MDEQYYYLCYECEYLYHCFGREMGEKIKDGNTEEIYLRTEACTSFYPERKQ